MKSPRHPSNNLCPLDPRNNLQKSSRKTKTPSSLKVTKPSFFPVDFPKTGLRDSASPGEKGGKFCWAGVTFLRGKRAYYPIASMGLAYSTLLIYHKNQQNVRYTSFMDPMSTTRDVQMRKSPLTPSRHRARTAASFFTGSKWRILAFNQALHSFSRST